MIATLLAHLPLLLSALLLVSECAAAVVQLLFPDNKGVSGVIAGIIKALQALGAKDPAPPQA